jgi:thioredoxin-related protein
VNGLQEELGGQIEIIKVDIYTAAGRELSAEFNSIATPTFILFDAGGNEVWRSIGSLDPDRVRAWLP